MLVRCLLPTHSQLPQTMAVIAIATIACLPMLCSQATAQVGQNPQGRAQRQQSTAVQVSPEQQQAQRDAADRAYAEHLAEIRDAESRATRQPAGFPLPGNQAAYMEQLLDHWQKVSDQIEAYRCNFQRFDYDSSIVNYRDPQSNRLAAYQVAWGEIKYAAKDKASFETTKMMKFIRPAQQPGGDDEWETVDGYTSFGKTTHERWICDGKSVFDFDFVGKRMYETEIPPSLQGNVVESPLPFLFGANKKDVMTRYWIRYIPKYRTDAKGQKQLIEDEYWLEAYPKTINDARMYSKLEIILAREDFMPIAIHMYSPQYDGKENFESRYFYFQDREVNSQLHKFQNFMSVFVRPKLPMGWKQLKRSMATASTANAQGPQNGQRK